MIGRSVAGQDLHTVSNSISVSGTFGIRSIVAAAGEWLIPKVVISDSRNGNADKPQDDQ